MTYFDTVATPEGEARVLTKKRWWNSQTSLLPADFQKLGREGVLFHWDTNDPALLKTLHDSLVEGLRTHSLADIRHAIDTGRGVSPRGAYALLVSVLPDSVLQHIRKLL